MIGFLRRLFRLESRAHSHELTEALRQQSQVAEAERHLMKRQRERDDLARVLADTWRQQRKDTER